MQIHVKLFAAARTLAGVEEIAVETGERPTAGEVKAALAVAAPALAQLARLSRIAVDARYVADNEPVAANSEVACIPPVSGG